ncbi:MAG: prealbumin-like fold domain-containing protein, partial [Chloroflexi bacterium]|nr:prealbumin-like fold domain-containing protein [Chloroflexota bacterium]
MSSRGAATRAAGARRGLTLTWLVLFIASILLQYGALIRPANVLANATGNQRIGGFEIDGDLFSGTMTPAGYDWAQGASSVGVVTTPTIVDPIGNADDTNFTQGSKEGDSPLTWNRGTGTASPKTDMGNIYIASQLLPQPPGADSHLWTYLGVERAANTGTTYYDFEFNQLPNVTVNNPDNKGGPISVPNRSDGDFLVVAQQQGNSSFDISATIQQWLGSAWSAPLPAPAGAFYGLSNDAPIPAGPWTDTIATNGLIPQSSFAEMAFDLTAFGVVLTCPSQGFGEVNVRSRESISDTASLADYASAPVRIPPNCATLAWQKQDGNGNPLGGATFTVAPNPFTGSGTGLDFTDYISASAQSDATKDQDARAGFFKLINVVPGTYTVTEKTAPPGYIKDSSSRSVTLEIFEDGSISIPFVNTRKTATTTLAVVGANPANGSYVAVGQSISLTVTETNTGQSVLHGIAVGGTNSCATWTAAANKNSGAGAFSGT